MSDSLLALLVLTLLPAESIGTLAQATVDRTTERVENDDVQEPAD